MPLSLLLTKLCFSFWIKAKNITPNSPIAKLSPQLKPIIGLRCKSTGVGDSFVTRMGKLAQACNIDQIQLLIDNIHFQTAWSIHHPKVSFKLREEVLKTDYPPFRNVIFREAANEMYNNFIYISVNKTLMDRVINIIYEWVPTHIGIVGNAKNLSKIARLTLI